MATDKTDRERFDEWLKTEKRLDPSEMRQFFRISAQAELYAQFEREVLIPEREANRPGRYLEPRVPAAFAKLSAKAQLDYLNLHRAVHDGLRPESDLTALAQRLGLTATEAA